jgi:hypothetical protein
MTPASPATAIAAQSAFTTVSLPDFGEGRVGSCFLRSAVPADPTRPRFRSATLPEVGEGSRSRAQSQGRFEG